MFCGVGNRFYYLQIITLVLSSLWGMVGAALCTAESWLAGCSSCQWMYRKNSLALLSVLLSNKMEKHLWAEEIMFEERHCHYKCQI